MKKILLSLGAACLLAVGAQAQVSYGIKAGVNLPKLADKATFDDADAQKDYDEDQKGVKNKAATNFYVTGYAKIGIAPNFYIQPGLSLQGKGGKVEESESADGDSWSETTTTNFLAIDIPVDLVYHIPAGAGNVLLGVGPYLGFNISGKAKSKWTETFAGDTESGEATGKLKFGSGKQEYKEDGENKYIVENAYKALD